jgi:hypothetical protein
LERANLRESAFYAGVRGAIMQGGTVWETREGINAAARAKGLKEPSLSQLARWRRVKLLPGVKPDHGSIVEYPPGTARQAVRLVELLGDKETFEHVGWELWWEGFEVGNHYWEPKLQQAAATGDLGIGVLKPLLALWRSGGGDEDETAFDALQRQIPARVLAPQITRRLNAMQMATFLRILADVGGGEFTHFDDNPHEDELSDYEIAVSGLDMENAGNYEKGPPGKSRPKPDQVFGKDMNFIRVLPNVLRAMAQTFGPNTLSDALKLPPGEVLAARDEVRGGLDIARDFYEATKWIYGNRAFGMRLAAWLARSAASQRALLVLGFALLKKSEHPFLSSDQIAKLAQEAADAKRDSLRLKEIAENDPRLGKLLTPKALRRAFSDSNEFKRFRRRLIAATTGP